MRSLHDYNLVRLALIDIVSVGVAWDAICSVSKLRQYQRLVVYLPVIFLLPYYLTPSYANWQ